MHYYVDGSNGSNFEQDYFYRYAPADGNQHEFAIYRLGSSWEICFDGVCPTTFSWKDPNTMTTTREIGGLEVAAGTLDSSTTNSGTFQLNTMLLRNSIDQWNGWPPPQTQVDRPCGTVPCLQGLQGWWAITPPPYDMWNNGQPQ